MTKNYQVIKIFKFDQKNINSFYYFSLENFNFFNNAKKSQ